MGLWSCSREVERARQRAEKARQQYLATLKECNDIIDGEVDDDGDNAMADPDC